jgi:hypothetical protein
VPKAGAHEKNGCQAVIRQSVAASNPKDLGMVGLLLELCHPQASLEAATRD